MDHCKGIINAIETFGLVDGPGVRFVVFVQGCEMRCKYCHNPETWQKKGEEVSSDEIISKVLKYKDYWGKDGKNGGLTVSGGEPLLQIDFLIDLFTLAKQNNIHTTIDTSGNPFRENKNFLEKFDKLITLTDLFIVDFKTFSAEDHKKLTGASNENILQMMKYLSDRNVPMWIRHVLVPAITDSEHNLKQISDFISKLNSVKRVEILPYHALAKAKWINLGIKYPLDDIIEPTREQVLKAEKILNIEKYNGE